ncbi:MAG: hypothetical protein HY055_06900 [Magnetospirillum sp.]|nr:hypothetical protein [Magnetospirillum sp.]
MSPRRFPLMVLLVAAAAIGATALINYLADPFAVWGLPRLGFYTPLDVKAERRYKMALRAHGDQRAVILGSSMATHLDPRALPGGEYILNMGLTAAAIPEMAKVAEALDRESAVIIALDFHMVRHRALGPELLDDAPGDQFGPSRGLIDLTVFRESLFAIACRLGGCSPSVETSGLVSDQQRVRDEQAIQGFRWEPSLSTVERVIFRDLRWSDEDVALLEQMKTNLERRGIRVFAFINPMSAPLNEVVRRNGLEPLRERARAEFRRIFPDLVDLSLVPGLDDPNLYYKIDPFHYRQGVVEPLIAPHVTRLLNPTGR